MEDLNSQTYTDSSLGVYLGMLPVAEIKVDFRAIFLLLRLFSYILFCFVLFCFFFVVTETRKRAEQKSLEELESLTHCRRLNNIIHPEIGTTHPLV